MEQDNLSKYLQSPLSVLTMVKSLCAGIIEAGSVNLQEVALRFRNKSSFKTNYRAVQRFFQKKSLNEEDVINYIISSLFKETESLTLAIDRTDWSFGKTRHNLLIISVLYNDTAVPLATFPLERKGNSNKEQRLRILDTILSVIPWYRIEALIGDREFIGDAWFKALSQRHIPFVMRIRNNTVIGKDAFTGKIEDFAKQTPDGYHGTVHIGKQHFHLSTTHSKNELISIISSDVKNPLAFYKKRWGIETGFKCLKSNGYNLEETHLREAKRMVTLVQICAIAMTISFAKIKGKIPKIIKKNTDTQAFRYSPMPEDS